MLIPLYSPSLSAASSGHAPPPRSIVEIIPRTRHPSNHKTIVNQTIHEPRDMVRIGPSFIVMTDMMTDIIRAVLMGWRE